MTKVPQLRLAHATLQVTRLDVALDFYRDVLGFHVTNQGEVPGGTNLAFISQDPDNHHQIVLVEGAESSERGFVLADHLAFRVLNEQEPIPFSFWKPGQR